MSDTPPDTSPHRSATDRAHAWWAVPVRDRYATGIELARDARRVRTAAAARQAIDLAADLASEAPPIDPAPDPVWELRGEPRTRATFGQPHPADFPGGLPLPGECPETF
jgi:hypothetical protein